MKNVAMELVKLAKAISANEAKVAFEYTSDDKEVVGKALELVRDLDVKMDRIEALLEEAADNSIRGDSSFQKSIEYFHFIRDIDLMKLEKKLEEINGFLKSLADKVK